jgi:hypothetical protein
VERFLKIPQNQLGDDRAGGVRVIGHRLRDGKLVLDLRYTISFSYRAGPGKIAEAPLPAPGGTSSYAAIAIYDMQNGAWQVALYPEPEAGVYRLPIAATPTGSNLRFELFREDIYLSEGEQIKKYSFAQQQWTVLKLPGQKPSDLFALNDRLFAANEESIFEILNGGKATKVLASCRRRPPVTLLDRLETLGQVTLYAGTSDFIRCVAGNALYTWNEAEWKQVAPLDGGVPLEVSDDGLILCANVLNQSYAIKWLKSEMTTPELCWKENLKPTGSFSPFAQTKPSSPAAKAIWKDKDLSLYHAAVASAGSNLVSFVEPELPQGLNAQGNAGSEVNDAQLVWLDRQFEKPLVIPIRFDQARGPALTDLHAQKMFQGFGNIANRSWMIWTRESLFIGSATTPGVWALPIKELEARLAKEREAVRRAAAK